MIAAGLLGAVLWSAAVQEPGLEGLVARLGSGNFDERVDAAEALARLGEQAVPALIEARDEGDLRVKRRADAVLDRIAAERPGRPTMVRLDFRDRPLEEVVAALNERHDLRLELWLDPPRRRGLIGPVLRADPAWKRRVERQPISLEDPDPVPLWEALDRLGRAGGLRLEAMPWERYGPRLGAYRLFAGRGGAEAASDDGPHRTIVTAVGPGGNGVLVDVAIIPEPGLKLVLVGPVELTEAIDDRGRSLIPPPEDEVRDGRSRLPHSDGLSGPVGITARINLDRPDPPGRSIARLRGRVPAVAVARRPDSLIIPLDGADGRVFRTDEVALVVHEVEADADGGNVVEVEVGVMPLRPYDRAPAPRIAVGDPDLVSYRGQPLNYGSSGGSARRLAIRQDRLIRPTRIGSRGSPGSSA